MSEQNKVLPDQKKIDSRKIGYITLALSVLFLSASPILLRLSSASGLITTFYRMLLTSFFFAPFFVKSNCDAKTCGKPELKWKNILLSAAAGVLSSFDYSLWAIALGKTSVSNATVLNSISPVWITLLALIFLHEKFKGKFWLGLTAVIAGVFFMGGATKAIFTSGFSQGDEISILSSVFYAGYMILTQISRRNISAIQHMWIAMTACAVSMGCLVFLSHIPFFGYDKRAVLIFFLSAFICQICGYYCMTTALGSLPASVVGPTIEIQPVISSFLAVWLLHEKFLPNQMIGCGLIILGVVLINRSKV